MKNIETLVEDIYGILNDGPAEITPEQRRDFGEKISATVCDALLDRHVRSTLRMSNIGSPCNRKLWYHVNDPGGGEDLPPEVRMKFLFGHIIEELLLFLTELAGHTVEGRQDEQEIEGIKGHRDAVIDGVLVDVKSASTYSFKKFEAGDLTKDDPFGYEDQLQSYLHAGQTDDKITDKDRAAFLVVDKTLGHVCLDIHKKKDFQFERMYQYKKEVVSRSEPPARKYEDVVEGKSGNRKLGTACSYCDRKAQCWPELRTFLYANKPSFLTKVVREPNVPELK